MRVQVIDLDYERGVKNDPCNCPFALAINRSLISSLGSLSKGAFAHVDLLWIRIVLPEDSDYVHRILRFSTPNDVRQACSAFDAGQPVDPIEFDLELDKAEVFTKIE